MRAGLRGLDNFHPRRWPTLTQASHPHVGLGTREGPDCAGLGPDLAVGRTFSGLKRAWAKGRINRLCSGKKCPDQLLEVEGEGPDVPRARGPGHTGSAGRWGDWTQPGESISLEPLTFPDLRVHPRCLIFCLQLLTWSLKFLRAGEVFPEACLRAG